MRSKKIRIVLLLSLALIVIFGLLLYTINIFRMRRPINFTELIDGDNISELTLTIYYLPRTTLTPFALTVNELTTVEYFDSVKITIYDLELYADKLRQLDSIVLVPVDNTRRINALLHYEFSARGRTFTVTGWGENNSLVVNGVEVERHYIFYEVILPFLTGDMADSLRRQVERIRSQ